MGRHADEAANFWFNDHVSFMGDGEEIQSLKRTHRPWRFLGASLVLVGAGFARKGKGLRPFPFRAARSAGPMPEASKAGPKNKTLQQTPLLNLTTPSKTNP
jgi:hypothetical protein